MKRKNTWKLFAKPVGAALLGFWTLCSFPIQSLASPEFAYSADQWAALRDNVLEYGELADLVHEYNVTVINNRTEYDEYRGKSHDSLKNAYQNTANRLYEYSDQIMDSVDEDQPGYASTAAQAALTRVQAEESQELANAQNEDARVKKLEYDRQEAELVKEAQKTMISYQQTVKEEPALQQALVQANAQYEAQSARAALGMSANAQVLEARAKAESAQAAILTNQKEQDSLRRQLCVMTGWSYDAAPEIREVPIPSPEEAGGIDLEKDKEQAIAFNYVQAANEQRLKYTGTGTQWEILNKKVETGEQNIRADVEEKYNLLKQAEADYIQASGEYELELSKALSAERRYQLGAITKNQYTEQQGSLAVKLSEKETAGLKYRQAMEDYYWAVHGLAQAEV